MNDLYDDDDVLQRGGNTEGRNQQPSGSQDQVEHKNKGVGRGAKENKGGTGEEEYGHQRGRRRGTFQVCFLHTETYLGFLYSCWLFFKFHTARISQLSTEF